MPYISDLVVIWYVIVVLWFSNHTMFTGMFYDDPGYESSLVTMSAQTCTGQRCFYVRHWVTVVFLTPDLYVLYVGETFFNRSMYPLLCGSLRSFL